MFCQEKASGPIIQLISKQTQLFPFPGALVAMTPLLPLPCVWYLSFFFYYSHNMPWQKSFKGERVYSCSQFRVVVHYNREVTESSRRLSYLLITSQPLHWRTMKAFMIGFNLLSPLSTAQDPLHRTWCYPQWMGLPPHLIKIIKIISIDTPPWTHPQTDLL